MCTRWNLQACTPTWAHARADTSVHSAHLAAGADPFSIGDFRERRVEAVDVIGGGAGITAKQLPSILTHSAKLNMVVVFFLHPFIPPVFLVFPFSLREIIPGLPLDPLLLLVAQLQAEGGGACVRWWGGRRCGVGQTGREGMRNGVKGKREGSAYRACACWRVEPQQREGGSGRGRRRRGNGGWGVGVGGGVVGGVVWNRRG